METVNGHNTFNPRVGYVVDADGGTAIATIAPDSVTKNYNEETGTNNIGSTTRLQVDPTTEAPKLEFDAARAVDDSALETLGIYVETDNGLKYKRGAERSFDALEIWWFDSDETDPGIGEPDKRERFEDATVDIDSEERDETTLTFSCEVHVTGRLLIIDGKIDGSGIYGDDLYGDDIYHNSLSV